MRFFAVDGLDGRVYGEYRGILQPVEDTSRELTDYSDCLCVVPALAFDTQGYRLGWGGGYYDRFFEAYPSIFKVGLAYSSSTTRTPIPRDGHDVPVDVVVTDKSIVLCGGRDEH
jgi:5-formyltetrahydrofolate cyclo-ligase